MRLDFSKLDNLSYKGCETPEQRQERDALIDNGYTIVEGIETPFTAPPPQVSISVKEQATNAQEGQNRAKAEDYKAIYRAVYEYHEKHPEPHSLKEWIAAAKDISLMAGKFDNSPFATDLLTAVYTEAERRYKAWRELHPAEAEALIEADLEEGLEEE